MRPIRIIRAIRGAVLFFSSLGAANLVIRAGDRVAATPNLGRGDGGRVLATEVTEDTERPSARAELSVPSVISVANPSFDRA